MRKIYLLFIFLPSLFLFGVISENPEDQIIQIENFITPEEIAALIEFHKSEKKDLNAHTDNGLAAHVIKNKYIRDLMHSISDRILYLINENYRPAKQQHVDLCAIFARTVGNSAAYHADNVLFDCPVHGRDQNRLRTTCDGTCPGSRFIPNHTSWRNFTGLLYLNDDFEGGEILFEDGPHNKLYRKIIKMKPGLLVITPDNPNFYHEVFPIKKGVRYSLHFWFTDDPRYMYRW